jgi:hypothetical protein
MVDQLKFNFHKIKESGEREREREREGEQLQKQHPYKIFKSNIEFNNIFEFSNHDKFLFLI